MKRGLILIFAGIIFFFNPTFNMFDILPDFLGCILIAYGLSRLSKIDENLESARKCSVYYAWISLLKLVLTMWTLSGHMDFLVPFTFSFAVLDIIFMLAFFRNLYTGLDYFSMRNNCEELRVPASNAFSMSAIFVVVSRILDFLPHLTDIFKQNDAMDLSYNASNTISLTALKTYIMALCLFGCLILGIIFIIITWKFFKKAISCKTLIEKAGEKYSQDILSNRELYVSLVFPGVYTFMYIGLFFMFDFSIDAINILPTFIAPVLFLFGARRLKKLETPDCSVKIPYIYFALSFVFSIANYIYTSKVNWGINYSFGTSSSNSQQFPLLSSPWSIVLQFLLSLAQCVFITIVLFSIFNNMKKVFNVSLRTSGSRKLTVCKINTVLLCSIGFIHSLSRAVIAHLSTYERVNTYIIGRSFISNEKELALALSDPLVRTFDILDTASIAVSILFGIITVWNMLYLSKVNLATEGSKN